MTSRRPTQPKEPDGGQYERWSATRDGLLSEPQLQVLALWLSECSASEIETLLQLEPETAEALRRAAVMKLRRHFDRTSRTSAT